MRLWSLHPKYLDTRGLVALWREALLAQAVLSGETSGYTRHPQLDRFRDSASPLIAIASFLRVVHAESVRRGYRFDVSKIRSEKPAAPIAVTRGQLDYEWQHLLAKLQQRDPELWKEHQSLSRPTAHPLFRIQPGPIAAWEVVTPASERPRT